MFALFKNHNPFAVIALFILTLVSRLVYINDSTILTNDHGQVVWQYIANQLLQAFGSGSFFLFILMVVNIFGQALLVNRISTHYDLFPKSSYLPAYNYILLTALLPAWQSWSVFSIVVWWVLLLLWYIFKLYQTKDGKLEALNIGMLTGIIALHSFPAAIMGVIGLLGLLILRSFKPVELLSFILGLALPYYLFGGLLYLTDKFYIFPHLFDATVVWPNYISITSILALSLIGLVIIMSLVFANTFIRRMLIEYKKYWSIIWLSLILTAIVSLLQLTENMAAVLLLLPCIALIFTFNYFYNEKKWYPTAASFLLLVGTVMIQWYYVTH